MGVPLMVREPLQSGASNNLKRKCLAICLSLRRKGDDSSRVHACSLIWSWRQLLWHGTGLCASGAPEPPAFGNCWGGLGVPVPYGTSYSSACCDPGPVASSALVSSGPVFRQK